MGGLRRVPAEGGEETGILPSVTFLNFVVVTEGIYFIPRADSEGRYSIRLFSFATRESEPVVSLNGRADVGFSVSQDGRSILYTQKDEPKSDLMLVENFR